MFLSTRSALDDSVPRVPDPQQITLPHPNTMTTVNFCVAIQYARPAPHQKSDLFGWPMPFKNPSLGGKTCHHALGTGLAGAAVVRGHQCTGKTRSKSNLPSDNAEFPSFFLLNVFLNFDLYFQKANVLCVSGLTFPRFRFAHAQMP